MVKLITLWDIFKTFTLVGMVYLLAILVVSMVAGAIIALFNYSPYWPW